MNFDAGTAIQKQFPLTVDKPSFQAEDNFCYNNIRSKSDMPNVKLIAENEKNTLKKDLTYYYQMKIHVLVRELKYYSFIILY